MKKIIHIIALLIIIAGFFVLIDPFIRQSQREYNAVQAVESFKKLCADDDESDNSRPEPSSAENTAQNSRLSDNEDDPVANSKEDALVSGKYSDLYKRMSDYNKITFKSNQSELRDAFSYTTSSIRFTDFGLPSDVAGYITIDRMNVELPLYVGSNQANMAVGATIMDHTSMPIGGKNTNCVIAAHRMGGFFGDIELLRIGDIVKVTNLWYEMRYKVEKIIVIDPYDTDKIKIIPGQDIITLMTCHPYWSNAKRYIVYCERTYDSDVSGETRLDDETVGQTEESTGSVSGYQSKEQQTESAEYERDEHTAKLPDGDDYKSSQQIITAERIVRIAGAAAAVILMIVCVISFFRSKKATTSGEEQSGKKENR